LREIETYRAILSPNLPSAPVCYGATVDHQLGRYWLFLEKVAGVELYQVGEFDTWKQVARWLADMHTRLRAETTKRAPHLLRCDEGFYQVWIDRAGQFLSDVAKIAWLAKRYDKVIDYLLALPVTFIHGEFYASNVLVQNTARGLRVCPVDWEMAAIGPGVFDIAALTSGRWTEDERNSLAREYYDALAKSGDSTWTEDNFLTALDFCRLQIAVQWLGWFGRRRAFSEHAQDWLSEAMHLAERLRL
jgi:aminoglycoside/choline kinase family phosphotransferase